eukprot:TRINITY_DN2804_c0_g1_i2.p1 TRINITY_DN2804_c0_g1~~TRINITY_DN2804_c0_g1_i2.p1  ORF type:complete len:221 (+),score=12.31 TRINITY_DN2804_c0_g1_i2:558-1220(+)
MCYMCAAGGNISTSTNAASIGTPGEWNMFCSGGGLCIVVLTGCPTQIGRGTTNAECTGPGGTATFGRAFSNSLHSIGGLRPRRGTWLRGLNSNCFVIWRRVQGEQQQAAIQSLYSSPGIPYLSLKPARTFMVVAAQQQQPAQQHHMHRFSQTLQSISGAASSTIRLYTTQGQQHAVQQSEEHPAQIPTSHVVGRFSTAIPTAGDWLVMANVIIQRIPSFP